MGVRGGTAPPGNAPRWCLRNNWRIEDGHLALRREVRTGPDCGSPLGCGGHPTPTPGQWALSGDIFGWHDWVSLMGSAG